MESAHQESFHYFPYLIVFGLLQWMCYELPDDFEELIAYYSGLTRGDYSSHIHFLQCWKRSPAVNDYRHENQRRLELVKLLFENNAGYICNGEPLRPNFSALEGLILRSDIPQTTICRVCGCLRRQFSQLHDDDDDEDDDGSRE